MGVRRVVNTDFWTDEKVEGFTPEERYFMLFLLTNPYVRLLGVYHITIKQMSFYTGYDRETIVKLLTRFERDYNLIKYSEADSEIAIKNFLKHSIVKGGKPIQDCLEADVKKIKNKNLINWVINEIDTFYANETVLNFINNYKSNNTNNVNDYVNDYDYVSYVNVSHNDTYNDTKPVRHKHGEYKHVLLTDNQYQKLIDDLGQDIVLEYIARIDEYCQQYGKSYKDYNLTIRKWVKNDNHKPIREDIIPKYDASENPKLDKERLNEILRRKDNI